MKTEKLYHRATGVYQDVVSEYVPAHLSNGWERVDDIKATAAKAEEPEGTEAEPEKDKKK